LDLSTHFFFGLAIGAVFFGRPEVVLLVGLGALLPDLDREYWFVRVSQYRDEQMHRARFHNVFLLALAYLLSPFLSLGMLLHMIQDSFTTVKDRGVEWFYPLTRRVKRGLRDADGNLVVGESEKGVFFYQEDLKGLTENADPDLRIEGPDPVPWRRVFGFAQNSQILDRGFLMSSIAVLAVWMLVPSTANLTALYDYLGANWVVWLAGYGGIALLYTAGEMDRRDKTTRLQAFKRVKTPVLGGGAFMLVVWGVLLWPSIWSNLSGMAVNYEVVGVGAAAVLLALLLTYFWQTKKTPSTV
jgi:hypothetical protein